MRILVLVAFLLGATEAMAGVVTVLRTGNGEPVPATGATVSLWRQEANDALLLGRWTTDEGGTVRLPDRSLEEATLLVVVAEGACRQDVPLGDERERLRVVLRAGATRPLVVLDDRGRPVTRFRWIALPWARFGEHLELARNQAFQSFRLDGPGLYRLPRGRLELEAEGARVHEAETETGTVPMEHLEGGEHLLLVGVPGYGVQAVSFDPSTEEPVVVRLPAPESCAPVRVVDRETGEPLAGVVAAPFPLFAVGPWRNLWPAVPTGPDGLLPTACPRFIRWVGDATGVLVAEDHAPLFPGEETGGEEEERSWTMDTGVVLSGTVTGEQGEPLAGSRVVATIRGIVLEGEADANGNFRIEGVPRGTVYVEVRGTGDERLLFSPVDTGEGDRLHLDLSLGRGFLFRLARNGEPWTGVRVALLEPGEQNEFRILGTAEPGPDGLVRLPVSFAAGGEGGDDLPDDLYVAILGGGAVVTVPLPGTGLLARIRSFFTGEEEPRTLDVRGRFVEGRVLDADTGDPVAGALLEGYRYGHCVPTNVDRSSPLYVAALGGYFKACRGTFVLAGCDDSGRFRLFLPAGVRTLEAGGPPTWTVGNEPPWTREARPASDLPPGEPVVFRLKRSAALVATVVTPNGQIPPGCTVAWRHVTNGPQARGHHQACRPGGTLLFPPPGVPVYVTAEAEGYARVVEGPFTLSPGRREQVMLALARPGSIRLELAETPTIGGHPWVPPGTLRDAAGRDMLTLARVTGTRDLRTIVFSDLPPGRYVVEILGERKKVELEEGEDLTVRVGF